MAKEDEIMEGTVPFLIIESLESNRHGDVLSPEDLAWVDSCLIKDPENSDGNWNALKDALMEIVNLQPEAVSYSSSRIDASSEGTDIEMYSPDEEAETAHLEKNDDDVLPINVESEINGNGHRFNNKTGIPLTKLFEVDDTVETFVRDPLLPSYTEGKRVSEATDLGLDLDPLAVEIEPLSEDIFKVWDLGVPDAEDELVAQLNRAQAKSSSTIDESGMWNDFKDESLDNLIAGIADESLDNLITGLADLSLDPQSS